MTDIEKLLAASAAFVLVGMVPAAAQKPAGTGLPAMMIGTWALAAADCADPDSNFLARVSANAVDFYASAFSFPRVVRLPDGGWRAQATIHEEGEAGTTKGSIELRVTANGHLRVRSGKDDVLEYVRCRKDPRQR